MAASVLVDTGFLIAFLNKRDGDHAWAISIAQRRAPPWKTCDAILSETFHVLGREWRDVFTTMIGRGALISAFHASDSISEIVELMRKYSNVPMSLADACLLRMTEILPDPLLLTTDSDFIVYRRHGRKIVPTAMPQD